MKKRLVKIGFAILILCVIGQFACATPVHKTFYSDGTIQDGDAWWGVDIHDTFPNHTTVNMTGGVIVDDGIQVYDAATFNFSGGTPGGIEAYDQSTVNIIDGLSAVYTTDNATVNILSNANVAMAGAAGFGTLNIYGGMIDQLDCDNSAIINIYDGVIGGIDGLGAYGSSVFNLMGGSITYIYSDMAENAPDLFAAINVFGSNLAETDTGGTYGYGQITGFWQNGSQFAIDFRDAHTRLTVNLIPEPATILLFGVGVFLLRKSKSRMQKSE